jgi:hypothetical protein
VAWGAVDCNGYSFCDHSGNGFFSFSGPSGPAPYEPADRWRDKAGAAGGHYGWKQAGCFRLRCRPPQSTTTTTTTLTPRHQSQQCFVNLDAFPSKPSYQKTSIQIRSVIHPGTFRAMAIKSNAVPLKSTAPPNSTPYHRFLVSSHGFCNRLQDTNLPHPC